MMESTPAEKTQDPKPQNGQESTPAEETQDSQPENRQVKQTEI